MKDLPNSSERTGEIALKTKFLTAIACTAVLTACATNAATSLFKDFKVNGQTVTASYQQGLYNDQIANGQKDSAQLRDAVKALAVERFAVRQEAEKTGIANDPVVQRRIEAAQIQILAQAISADYLKKSPIPEAQVVATYKQAQKEYGNNEYRIRQIFVDNEADANALKAKLAKRPSSFAEYAKTDNDNKALAQRSGDMGWVSASVFKDPEFKAAVLRTKAGSNAEVIKSKAGWHFLRVEAIRPAQAFPSYEKAKVEIANRLAQEKARAHLSKQ